MGEGDLHRRPCLCGGARGVRLGVVMPCSMSIERFRTALLGGAMLLAVPNGFGQGVASGAPGSAGEYVPTFTFDVASNKMKLVVTIRCRGRV